MIVSIIAYLLYDSLSVLLALCLMLNPIGLLQPYPIYSLLLYPIGFLLLYSIGSLHILSHWFYPGLFPLALSSTFPWALSCLVLPFSAWICLILKGLFFLSFTLFFILQTVTFQLILVTDFLHTLVKVAYEDREMKWDVLNSVGNYPVRIGLLKQGATSEEYSYSYLDLLSNAASKSKIERIDEVTFTNPTRYTGLLRQKVRSAGWRWSLLDHI